MPSKVKILKFACGAKLGVPFTTSCMTCNNITGVQGSEMLAEVRGQRTSKARIVQNYININIGPQGGSKHLSSVSQTSVTHAHPCARHFLPNTNLNSRTKALSQ